MFTVQNKVH